MLNESKERGLAGLPFECTWASGAGGLLMIVTLCNAGDEGIGDNRQQLSTDKRAVGNPAAVKS
jgi:hypothetical protein